MSKDLDDLQEWKDIAYKRGELLEEFQEFYSKKIESLQQEIIDLKIPYEPITWDQKKATENLLKVLEGNIKKYRSEIEEKNR